MTTDYIEQFVGAIREAGLIPPDMIEPDGNLYREPHPRGQNAGDRGTLAISAIESCARSPGLLIAALKLGVAVTGPARSQRGAFALAFLCCADCNCLDRIRQTRHRILGAKVRRANLSRTTS